MSYIFFKYLKMINGCVVFKYKLKLLTLHFGTNKTNK